MKKFLVVLFIVIVAVAPLSVITASADSDADYYVVGDTEIQFFEMRIEPVYKFSIPKDYAFTVVENNVDGSSYAKVVYSDLEGLVKQDSLAKCTKTANPSRTAPTLELTLNPRTAFTTPECKQSNEFDGTAIFLGKYQKDSVTAYAFKNSVGNGGTIYYTMEKMIDNIDSVKSLLNGTVNIPDKIETGQNDQSGSSTKETPQNKTILRIILVLGIVIPAFIIILIIFKSGKKTQKIEREVPDDSDRFDDY